MNSDAQPSTGLFCVCDPDGALIHTTVARTEDSVFMWLEIEGSMNVLQNVARQHNGQRPACLQSWEGYEAEGYGVVPVSLVPEVPLA